MVTHRGADAPPLKTYQIIGEYIDAAKRMAPYADYLMLNLSCPNTADGRDFFADAGHLKACLDILGEMKLQLPVFLKVSPQGGIAAIERVLAAADGRDFVSGFMFNLPPAKPGGLRTAEAELRNMPGAVSGRPAAALPISHPRPFAAWIASAIPDHAGGVATAEHAMKIRLAPAGAIAHRPVYRGPGVVREITAGLAQLLERDGVKNIADAVGVDAV